MDSPLIIAKHWQVCKKKHMEGPWRDAAICNSQFTYSCKSSEKYNFDCSSQFLLIKIPVQYYNSACRGRCRKAKLRTVKREKQQLHLPRFFVVMLIPPETQMPLRIAFSCTKIITGRHGWGFLSTPGRKVAPVAIAPEKNRHGRHFCSTNRHGRGFSSTPIATGGGFVPPMYPSR